MNGNDRLKVLIIAVACHPSRGSEAHFGWTALRAISQEHDVWAVVHEHDRESIEAGQKADPKMAGVHFCFHGAKQLRSRHGLVARVQNWLDYRSWSRSAEEFCRQLQREIGFDLGHHVTMASWRMGSPLCQTNIPFVFGPVGGGEAFPLALLKTVSLPSAIFEMLRRFSNFVGTFSPTVKSTLQKAGHVLAANGETQALLLQMGANLKNTTLLSPAFLPMDFYRAIVAHEPAAPLQLFCGGELEGRKGISLALHALHLIKKEGIVFHYVIGGGGGELAHLQRLVRELDLGEEVQIGRYFQGEEYRNILAASDVYFLPSLRDSAGITLLEGMASGCIPVVCNLGGPGLVAGSCGYRITPVTSAQTIADLAAALREIHALLSQRNALRADAARRAREEFSELAYARRISQIYRDLT